MPASRQRRMPRLRSPNVSRGAIARYGILARYRATPKTAIPRCRVEAKLDFNRRFRRAHVNEPAWHVQERAWELWRYRHERLPDPRDASEARSVYAVVSGVWRSRIRRRKTERSAGSRQDSGSTQWSVRRTIELVVEKHAAGRTSIPAVSGVHRRMSECFRRRSREQKIEAVLLSGNAVRVVQQAHRPAARWYAVRWVPVRQGVANRIKRPARCRRGSEINGVQSEIRKGLCGRRLVGGPVGSPVNWHTFV